MLDVVFKRKPRENIKEKSFMALAVPPLFHPKKWTTNYSRLCRLLVDVSSHILRETFEEKRPPGNLDTVLSSPSVYAVLQTLRTRKVLNPSQWGKLYPTIKSSVSSQHFDITLLIVLLRNICGLVPPDTGWDKLPPAEDTTLEADIVRIKCYRNTVYGHASRASVDDQKFNQYWQDIQDVLVRLGGAGYQSVIDDLKKECMDPEFEEHYRELLKQWVIGEVSVKERLDGIEEKLDKGLKALEVKMNDHEAAVSKDFTKMRIKRDVNILILGETGVGKSTWINAIANYSKYNSLEAARKSNEFTVLIPFSFTYTTKEGEEKAISFGHDANEVCSIGQSATQFAREHTFETDIARFHLIDTPGIGDCRGIKKDKENFANTLAYLTNYEKINAVVVLLKSNNSRLTVSFQFCVLELLRHLHKSLVSNIIFAFTNSRGTFYQPGDSLPVLKKLLSERMIGIDVSPSNYFCFDNEAFRFLACNKKGVEFGQEQIDSFSKSWKMSCETTIKLFQRVMEMEPHDTKQTLSLNDARNYVLALSKPMGEVFELIQMNLEKIERAENTCKAFDNDINSFKMSLKFKGYDLKVLKIDYPMTVCAAEECKKYVFVGEENVKRTVYEKICHDHCYLQGVMVESIGNDKLFHCIAMSSGSCLKCSHNYRTHMHIEYKTSLIEKEFLSKEVPKKILDKQDKKSQKKEFIAVLAKKSKELASERDCILECATFFGAFLKMNAIVPYNDSFRDYMELLIRNEECKEEEIRDDEKIKKLKEDLRAYKEEVEVLRNSVASQPCDGEFKTDSIEEISVRKEKLCSLKHNGRILREALDGVMSARQRMHEEERKSQLQVSTHGNQELFKFIKRMLLGQDPY